jgi:hypothetical protein
MDWLELFRHGFNVVFIQIRDAPMVPTGPSDPSQRRGQPSAASVLDGHQLTVWSEQGVDGFQVFEAVLDDDEHALREHDVEGPPLDRTKPPVVPDEFHRRGASAHRECARRFLESLSHIDSDNLGAGEGKVSGHPTGARADLKEPFAMQIPDLFDRPSHEVTPR